MIKMELKNLTKSYEKGKIALDHFSAALEKKNFVIVMKEK